MNDFCDEQKELIDLVQSWKDQTVPVATIANSLIKLGCEMLYPDDLGLWLKFLSLLYHITDSNFKGMHINKDLNMWAMHPKDQEAHG